MTEVLMNIRNYVCLILHVHAKHNRQGGTVFLWLFLPKQSQRSRSILQDGSRSLELFRKGKIGIIAKFHRTDLDI